MGKSASSIDDTLIEFANFAKKARTSRPAPHSVLGIGYWVLGIIYFFLYYRIQLTHSQASSTAVSDFNDWRDRYILQGFGHGHF